MQLSNPGASQVSIKQTDANLARNQDADTFAGAAFAAQANVSAGSGVYPHFQLYNPAGSGVLVYLDVLLGSRTTAGIIQAGEYSTAIGGGGSSGLNKYLGGAASTAEGRTLNNATRLGSYLYNFRIAAGATLRVDFNRPIIIPQGRGFIVVPNTVNINLTVSIEWREFAT